MRTQLLFALAVMCGGAAASAQQTPARVPGSAARDGAVQAIPTDATSSYSRYAAGSARAATAASVDDSKEASKIQLTAGVSGPASGMMSRIPTRTEPIPVGVPVADATPFVSEGVPVGYGGAIGGSDSLFWVSAGVMAASGRAVRLPSALVTTSSLPPTARFAGAIGVTGTSVLFGDKIDYDTYYGGQASVGMFLGDSGTFSGEVRGFYLEPDQVTFSAASNAAGSPFITRPFFNLAERREAAVFNAKPGVASGAVSLKGETQTYGFEVNGRAHFGTVNTQGISGSALLGFRYLRLEDRLAINDSLTPLVANQVSFGGMAVSPGSTIADTDSFHTTNDFYGAQIGGQVNCELSWLLVNAYAKLGFGVTQQEVKIAGATSLSGPAGTAVIPGGVYALSSNIGTRRIEVFGFVPEWGLNLGAAVTQNLRVTVGYSFLLWNRVLRTGDVIDRGLNPALIPTDGSFGSGTGPDRPSQRFRETDNVFWLHAVNAGVEVIF